MLGINSWGSKVIHPLTLEKAVIRLVYNEDHKQLFVPRGIDVKKHLRTAISFKLLFSLADFAKKMIKDKEKRKKIHFLRHQKSPYDAGP